MSNGTRVSSGFNWMGWIFGSGGLLLIVSAGLQMFVRQNAGELTIPTMLEALYLAFWSYVLGIAVLLLLPAGLVVVWLRARDESALKSDPAAAMNRHLAEPELGGCGSHGREGVSSQYSAAMPA